MLTYLNRRNKMIEREGDLENKADDKVKDDGDTPKPNAEGYKNPNEKAPANPQGSVTGQTGVDTSGAEEEQPDASGGRNGGDK
jgi:hypothetical protein